MELQINFFRFFIVYFQLTNKENVNYHVISAKRKVGNKSSNYSISCDKSNFSKKSDSYLGKLRSNFVGTEFKLYDTGFNPATKSV